MNLVIPLSHDHAVHAIDERIRRPGTDPLLLSVVAAVMTIHVAYPSATGRPDPDCPFCEGTGLGDVDGRREHCHCRCPWCAGCEEPVCEGPCETAAAIADALGIEGA